ncbi:MAG: hypothetical protein QGI86_21650 [Candidatus Poribacteria bacterium]|nr:hypothetical protein [Candidatus Poribacteria bacterium]MDP6750347.1 hypothetical protein [Candidatus Poribacteria bacterium]MDP6995052.1 hypothetical protein [Candidatus Poribacteria bacterium]
MARINSEGVPMCLAQARNGIKWRVAPRRDKTFSVVNWTSASPPTMAGWSTLPQGQSQVLLEDTA